MKMKDFLSTYISDKKFKARLENEKIRYSIDDVIYAPILHKISFKKFGTVFEPMQFNDIRIHDVILSLEKDSKGLNVTKAEVITYFYVKRRYHFDIESMKYVENGMVHFYEEELYKVKSELDILLDYDDILFPWHVDMKNKFWHDLILMIESKYLLMRCNKNTDISIIKEIFLKDVFFDSLLRQFVYNHFLFDNYDEYAQDDKKEIMNRLESIDYDASLGLIGSQEITDDDNENFNAIMKNEAFVRFVRNYISKGLPKKS